MVEIGAAGGVTGSGRARCKYRCGGGRRKGVFVDAVAGADLGQGFDRQIAVWQLPLVIGFHQDGADEAYDGCLVWKDADDIGAPFHFLVEPLQTVGGVEL